MIAELGLNINFLFWIFITGNRRAVQQQGVDDNRIVWIISVFNVGNQDNIVTE